MEAHSTRPDGLAMIDRHDQRTLTPEPRTLAVDIGGTGVKAIVLDMAGDAICDRVKLPTPRPATPENVLSVVATLR